MAVILAVMLPVWLSSTTTSVAAPGAAQAPSQAVSPPAVPGPGHAYLGAFVDPSGSALSSTNPTGSVVSIPPELADLPGFNRGLSRPLSVVQVYQSWTAELGNLVKFVQVTQLDQISADGAIPMINWSCGATDASVLSGADDAMISGFAEKLAASGLPIFLRWFGDPNAASLNGKAAHCLGGSGPAGYVEAFRHIHDLLVAAGATNVAFVWSIDPTVGNPASWESFYPGSAYVDWIGADGYYSEATPPPAGTVATEFGSWYSAFSSDGKPLMISSTGASPLAQREYLDQLATVLPDQFPLIKSVNYFDAPNKLTGDHYSLNVAGQEAFQNLSGRAYFQPARSPTTTTVAASPTPVSVAQVVQLTAQVSGPDQGGSLSFLDNGRSIASCGAVPVRLASSCDTSSLPLGDNRIVAVYSGDTMAAGSTSAPLQMVVGPVASSVSPPSIPGPGQAYLGAWVKPIPLTQLGTNTTPVGEELQLLPQFDAGLGRPLGIVHVYQQWKPQAPNNQLRQVLADGGIPMIDWSCGDTDANVIAGNDDAWILNYARQLAALKSPLFLRWYYEPNFPESTTYAACISTLGPAGYVQAFRHIHDLFAEAGATNVAFVWTIASSGTDRDFIDYYPGSAYVDWIAADGYDRSALPEPDVFDRVFKTWYADFASFGKPLMITETGAIAGGQAAYFQEIQRVLPSEFPLLKGVAYFDAAAHAGLRNYPLDASGLAAFQALSRDPVFQPQRRATAIGGVSASPASPLAGQEVQLTTSLSATDLGGSLSFYNDGSTTPIAGCADVPVSSGTFCNTDALAAGANSVVAVYSGDAQFGPSSSAPVRLSVVAQPVSPTSMAPPIPGPGHAYLGAWLSPTGKGSQPETEVKSLAGFNSSLGRPLSIVHVYQSWTGLTPAYQIRQVRASGAIPMIDWECGDSDANIIAGVDDPLITDFARELALLKTPVFLRWYYEPNFPGSPDYARCIGTDGPQGYQLAFQHIHNLFEAAGATNVAFVWSVAASGSLANLTGYYPGSAYVDWIGVDGYARTSTPEPVIARNLFGNWYAEFSTFGKPMMISETGAYQGGQAQYLQQLATDLPTEFPLVQALVYFDAPGRYQVETYPLDSSGMQEFEALSRSPYFQPERQPTSTTVTASPPSARWRQRVELVANVSTTDNGGSVGFFVNGQPVAGCESVPVDGVTPTCHTTKLPSGPDSITAVYTGDANYAGSTAAPVSEMMVGPAGAAGGAGAAGASGTNRSGAALPMSAMSMAPFLGMPTISPVAPLKMPGSAGVETASQTGAGGPNNSAGRSGPYVIQPASAFLHGRGYGFAVVLAGLALAAGLATYIVSTWVTDRRSLRRKVRRA